MSQTHIGRTTGKKDDRLFYIRWDKPRKRWYPRNEELFVMLQKWFEADEAYYSDGYGSSMPWFYTTLIHLGYPEETREVCGLNGIETLRHFERCVDQYGEEVVSEIQRLRDEKMEITISEYSLKRLNERGEVKLQNQRGQEVTIRVEK